MKKIWIILLVILVLVAGGYLLVQSGQKAVSAFQTEEAHTGDLTATVSGSGTLRGAQTVLLLWKVSGVVEEVAVTAGDEVQAGQVLARLEQTSLPPQLLQAQITQISARRNLDNLLNSATPAAQAWKALEDAQRALEDAQIAHQKKVAQALADLAAAQQDLEDAQEYLAVVSAVPSSQAIQQAYANLVLAQNKLADIDAEIERINKKLSRDPKTYMPWESKQTYRKILDGLEINRVYAVQRLEEAQAKYDAMLEPPDPIDVAVAEAAVRAAQAQLEDAQRVYERLKDGPSAAEIALLEAQVADARREWERLRDAPPQDEIVTTEAQIAAAQATLEMAQLISPIDGVVTEVHVMPSDRVEPGTLAFRIDDLSAWYIDVQVTEVDVPKLHPGQDAVITFEGVFARLYHGKVIDVGMVGTSIGGTVYYKVVVKLTDPDGQIRPGMTASVDMVTDTLRDVLLVPNRAVRYIDQQPHVYILRNGMIPEAVPIKLGESSALYSQVLEGDIKEGDPIVLNPPSLFFEEQQGGPPPFVRR